MSARPFSPQREDAATLSERTVGRAEVLDTLRASLLTAATTDSKPHILLVGPRGAGKSHVVEVALYRAASEPAFAERTVVVRIPEDSNDITRYSDLQRRILRVLDPQAPLPPSQERAGAVEHALGDRVLILVVENLDRVFADIGLEGQRNLRAWAETSRKVMLLATTPLLFPEVAQRDKPWFGGLATYVLPDLSAEEGQELVALLADARGDSELAGFVRSSTGAARMAAVARLTGGSPRIWMILAQVATKESLDELVPAVEDLLEGLVPYYQQLLWSLSPTERQLITQLSQTGMMTVAQLAQASDVDPATTGNTLRRLAQARWVMAEKPRSGDQRQTYYWVREPMLRYHLQYREEAGEPLALVVSLLKALYTSRELASDYLQTNAGTLSEKYLFASLGPIASSDALVLQPHDEFPLLVLDWLRSSDPDMREAGRVLREAWRGLGVDERKLADAIPMAIDGQTVDLILRLVSLCLRMADFDEFERLMDEAWKADSALAVSFIAENAAARLGRSGDYVQALDLLGDVLVRLVQDRGKDAKEVLLVRAMIAYWTGVRNPTHALALQTGLLDDLERVLGSDQRETLITRHDIASSTARTDDPAHALELYSDVLTDMVRILGPDHPDTLTTRHNIAYWTAWTQSPGEALAHYTDLLPDITRVLGRDDPTTLNTLRTAARLARSWTDLLPLIKALGQPLTELALGSLAIEVWRVSQSSPEPIHLGSSKDLIQRIASAAQGDDAARASLPPELLQALEESS